MAIEVELRSFIPEEKFNALFAYFRKEADYLGIDNQETWYFDALQDLRIQKNDAYAKIWIKKGKMHDECREEVEIKFDRKDFGKLDALFSSLGYGVSIKWFRTRHSFLWEGVSVTLDDTRGYGRILELERLVEEAEKDAALTDLKEKIAALGVAITSREEFDRRFREYEERWKRSAIAI
jgi:predicted adenylyl cyclase CyaB